MARALTVAVDAAVAAPAARVALFAEFAFDSGAVRLWSGIGQVTWDGKDWQGAGTLGAISLIEETTELRATGVTFTLSGVPSSLLAVALGEHYQGRACALWLAFLDAAWTVIADPIQVFAGRMDTAELTEGGARATIRIAAENRLVDLERGGEALTYTPEDQKRLFPGDRGLDYVPALQEKIIYWGKHVLAPARPARTGGAPVPSGGTTGARPGGLGGFR